MMDVHRLKSGTTLYEAACRMNAYLQRYENMKTCVARLSGGGYVLHARVRGGSQRRWIGLDKTVTIILRPSGTGCARVEITGLKWRDKAVVLLVSLFALWQLAVPALWGLYEQMRLPARLKKPMQECFDLYVNPNL